MNFICYPKCTTCQKARKWLTANNIDFTERHIAEDNPSYDELKEWYAKSGLPLKKFFNTSGNLYKELKLKDKLPTMSEEEQLQLLATNGMLVKRPIMVEGDTVLVGFKEAEWEEKLASANASFADIIRRIYTKENYNCAETIIHAGNEYYSLDLHDRDMIMLAGYGGGIQTGNTCGAILSGVAILSMKYVEAKAHESADLKPIVSKMMRRFRELWNSTLCKDIKAQNFSAEERCLKTILTAGEVVEETISWYEGQK